MPDSRIIARPHNPALWIMTAVLVFGVVAQGLSAVHFVEAMRQLLAGADTSALTVLMRDLSIQVVAPVLFVAGLPFSLGEGERAALRRGLVGVALSLSSIPVWLGLGYLFVLLWGLG